MNRDQLYAMNIHYRYYDLEYFFRACQKMNLKHAELWLCPQHFYINSMWSESPEKLKGLMKRSGVQISCICPEQNNPKPNNIAARSELLIENTRKYFQNVIILASELGCDKILVTPGWNYHDEEVDEARKRSIRMLQSLCDIADPYGISLAMESIWDHSSDIANTKEKVKLIKDGKPAGCPTGHMPWGLGERNMLEVLKAFEANEYRGGFSMEYVDARSFRNPEKWDRQTVEQFESCLERM